MKIEDELALARLLCIRLSRMLQGILSTVLPGLVTGFPPKEFLRDHFRKLASIADVLNIVNPQPLSSDRTRQLRQDSSQLREVLNRLHEELESVGDVRPTTPPGRFVRIKEAIGRAYDLLSNYSQFLGLDLPMINKNKETSLCIVDDLPRLARDYKPIASTPEKETAP